MGHEAKFPETRLADTADRFRLARHSGVTVTSYKPTCEDLSLSRGRRNRQAATYQNIESKFDGSTR